MKAAVQAAGGRLLYTVKCFWPVIFFPISTDKTGADPADGCDKIKPPPLGMNAKAHVDGSSELFTGTNFSRVCTLICSVRV